MDLQYFVELFCGGLTRGSIYALIALGYTMVYGIIELINFAHGEIYMIGAFTALIVASALGIMGFPAAGIIVIAALAAVIWLPRIIPREEIEQLLNHIYKCLEQSTASDYKYILRDAAVIELFFATGARVYEVSNIKEENINLNTGLIRLMGKGNKERYVQISNPAVLAILKKYYKENKTEIQNSGFFFVNCRGSRFTEQSIRLMLKKYTNQAGIKRNITPHMFRHSFATYLIEEGVDVSCVQQILGHSSIKTTQIYIHIAARKQAEILKELHPRNKMDIVGAV